VSPPGIAWTERKQATLGGVTPDSPGFDRVRAESAAEGHRMLDRFAEHWHDGTNRFDRPGEVILGAFLGDELIGICGRNRDPFDPHPRAGRVRHLYVATAHRRTGVARTLINAIVDGAVNWFDYLNTNCPPEAAPFYEHLGFVPVTANRITHRLTLRR
jgi:GNAT superfamily N-acetyltransferase